MDTGVSPPGPTITSQCRVLAFLGRLKGRKTPGGALLTLIYRRILRDTCLGNCDRSQGGGRNCLCDADARRTHRQGLADRWRKQEGFLCAVSIRGLGLVPKSSH